MLGSAKQRALLAILLLHANEVVSRDRLIDDLWGERPPASAPHSLEVYVSRLRKALQPDGGERMLVTRPGGYLLRLEPDQLDLGRFERLVDDGRRSLADGNYERAAESTCRGARALAWTGARRSRLRAVRKIRGRAAGGAAAGGARGEDRRGTGARASWGPDRRAGGCQ